MIKQAGETYVTFCELVDHPGGHDGGEFPQDHDYYLTEDGGVEYVINRPFAPNNDFGEEDLKWYSELLRAEDDRAKAVELLTQRLELATRAAATTTELLQRLKDGKPFTVSLQEEEEDAESDD